MLKIKCPGCEAGLRVDESKRGRTVRCPKCEHRFTVPAPPPPEDEEEEVELLVVEKPKPKKKRKSYGLKDEPEAPRPMPRYDRDDEEDEDRPRIRRKRRGKTAVGFAGFLTAEWNLDKIVVVLVAGFWLIFTGLSLVPVIFFLGLLGLFGFGSLMLAAARIWCIAAAFSEDSTTGCLTLFFPWYGMFNIEDRRPLFLFGMGFLYFLTGIGILFMYNAMGRFGE